MDLLASLEGGDEHLADKEFQLRQQRREETMRTLEAVTEAGYSPLKVLSDDVKRGKADSAKPGNADGLLKWRQQCLIEALVATDGAAMGANRRCVHDRDDLFVVSKGSARAGIASVMTAEESARVTRTIVFVNTVETAKELESFLKKAGACDSTVYNVTWVLSHGVCRG